MGRSAAYVYAGTSSSVQNTIEGRHDYDVPNVIADIDFDISDIQEKSAINDSGFMLENSMEIVDTDSSYNESGINLINNTDDIQNIKSKKKIHRPCPFEPCKDTGKLHSALTRHIRNVYKYHPDVIRVRSLPRREQLEAFARFKNEGILP